MNEIYDYLNLNKKNKVYYLRSFNNEDLGIVRFNKYYPILAANGTWKKVQVYLDKIIIEGYLDVFSLKQISSGYISRFINEFLYSLNKVKSHYNKDTDEFIENSRLINDLVIKRSSISSEDKALFISLMHLGIDYNKYILDPLKAISEYFGNIDIKLKAKVKMKSFYSCLISAGPQEKIIIKKLLCDFISILKNTLNFIKFWPKPLLADKDIMIFVVSKNGYILEFLVEDLKNDKDVVLAAISKNTSIIYHASDGLKSDKYFMLDVVTRNGLCIEYVLGDLNNDKDVVLAAVSQNGWALKHASDDLKSDKDVVLAAVSQNGWALKHASDDLKSDKDVVLAAVGQNGWALKHASDDLKSDKDFMLTAIGKNKLAIRYAGYSLVINKEFILSTLNMNGLVLESVCDSWKNDKKSVLIAVNQNIRAVKYASFDLQNDPEVVLTALISFCKKIIGNIIPNISHITEIYKLFKGYERFKENPYSYNQEGYSYVKAVITGKNKNKIKKNLLFKLSKIKQVIKLTETDRKEYIKDFKIHLKQEGLYLKMLDIKNPKFLRFTFFMVKKIINYRNDEIKELFFDIIESLSKESFINFIEKLLTICDEMVDLILPSIILSTLNINKDMQNNLYDALKIKRKILRDQFNPHLQNLIKLEHKLTNITLSVDHEKIADIVIAILNTTDSNEILSRINFLIFILNIRPESLSIIEDFSSFSLLSIVLDPFIKLGLLENTFESRDSFGRCFLNSRIPYAIFSYVSNFINDQEMLVVIKKFIEEIIKDSYLTYRHDHNSHKHLLTDDQKLIWETSSSRKLDSCETKKVLFDPLEFLRTKLVLDGHGLGKLDGIVGVIESGAVIRRPNKVEKLCIDLLNQYDSKEQLDILKELQISLENEEYRDIEFKSDVKDQITLIENRFKTEFNLIIKDTEDWQDLFFCGTEIVGSCQRVDGDPQLNRCILGYVLDGKIRMIKICKKDEVIIARSIIKIMKDSLGNPALLLERIYPDDKYALYIRDFAKQKAQFLGIDLYEYCPNSLIELHSEGNIASFEFEDAGGGVNKGVYSVNVNIIV